MSAYLDPRDGKTWRYRCWVRTHDGRKVRVSGKPNVNTKQAASLAERAHMLRAETQAPEQVEARDVPTFGAYAETFMATYAIRNKPSERASKRSILDLHLLPAWGDQPITEVASEAVKSLTAKLLKSKELSPKRVNNVLNVVSRILNEAVEDGVLATAPRVRSLKVPTADFDFFTFEEFERLVVASRSEPEWHAAIVVAGDAGLRLGEIQALKWDAVDLVLGQLKVSRNMWRGIVGTPKGGKPRTIPLTARAIEALSRLSTTSEAPNAQPRSNGDQRQGSGYVFHREDGSPWSNTNMRAGIKRQQKRAGLRVTGWHVLRHTFCSHLAMRGAAPKAIQDLAGHQSIATTNRYMHMAPAELRSAIALLEGGPAVASSKVWPTSGQQVAN
jgi:integrase